MNEDNYMETESSDNEQESREILFVVIGIVLAALSFLPFWGDFIRDLLRIFCAVICGIPTAVSACESLKNKRINECVLLVIAVAAAFFLKDFLEAAAVSAFYRVGEMLEDFASSRSKKSIESIFSIVSDEANILMSDGSIEKADAETVQPGTDLVLLPHDVIPVDGIVTSGFGTVDMSVLTGESVPVSVVPGTELTSGGINGNNTIFYRSTACRKESGAARIVSLVENAVNQKGDSERFVSRFARYYTPVIVALSVFVFFVPGIITGMWGEWLHRSLVLLVASCPCAIVFSVPLAFLSSMGSCARNGMIIKGGDIIEKLAEADTFVFDKTGTITTDVPEITGVRTYGKSESEVFALASKCEAHSSHPYARAIVEYSGEPDLSDVKEATEIPGGGTSAVVPEGKILCGSRRLMENENIKTDDGVGGSVFVALNGKLVGCITIGNKIREDAQITINMLRKSGVGSIGMLTGDAVSNALSVGASCGLDFCRAELLPEDKIKAVRELKKDSASVVYVGDGINDVPVLAESDVGIAMGFETQAACQAADVIITGPKLSCIADTLRQSKKTMSVLKTNIVLAIVVKLIVIILGVVGIAPMTLAVFADVGTMIICVLNSARLLKINKA